MLLPAIVPYYDHYTVLRDQIYNRSRSMAIEFRTPRRSIGKFRFQEINRLTTEKNIRKMKVSRQREFIVLNVVIEQIGTRNCFASYRELRSIQRDVFTVIALHISDLHFPVNFRRTEKLLRGDTMERGKFEFPENWWIQVRGTTSAYGSTSFHFHSTVKLIQSLPLSLPFPPRAFSLYTTKDSIKWTSLRRDGKPILPAIVQPFSPSL